MPQKCMQCPASMCPLLAPKGSPWTGTYGAKCPGHDDIETDGCPWWSMACGGGGMQMQVEEAAQGTIFVIGPKKPNDAEREPIAYDCAKTSVCRWQEQAELVGRKLCPPRDALARGIDPRVCLF